MYHHAMKEVRAGSVRFRCPAYLLDGAGNRETAQDAHLRTAAAALLKALAAMPDDGRVRRLTLTREEEPDENGKGSIIRLRLHTEGGDAVLTETWTAEENALLREYSLS